MTFDSLIIRLLLIIEIFHAAALMGWQENFPHLRYHKSKETLQKNRIPYYP